MGNTYFLPPFNQFVLTICTIFHKTVCWHFDFSLWKFYLFCLFTSSIFAHTQKKFARILKYQSHKSCVLELSRFCVTSPSIAEIFLSNAGHWQILPSSCRVSTQCWPHSSFSDSCSFSLSSEITASWLMMNL